MAENQEILVIPKRSFDELVNKVDKIMEAMSGNPRHEKDYMTIEELGEYLKISDVTVYKYIREHGLPTIKIGSKRRFIKEKIDKWVAEHEIN